MIQPEASYEAGDPLLLTVEGEFVVKNLVLLTAAMEVGATVRSNGSGALRAETIEALSTE